MHRFYRRTVAIVGVLSTSLAGCAHQIAFDKAQYSIATTKQQANVVVVIDQETLANTVSIRSFMTGIAHSWDAQPGEMLKQVADIEFPQAFSNYETVASYEYKRLAGGLVVTMTIPSYDFSDFHAKISVRAIARDAGSNIISDKTYTAEGESQGAKMFWAGPFGMKSAIRQSSIDAYKKIFAPMRLDLQKSFDALSPR